MQRMLGNRVHLSTLCLVTIGLFDLVTTLMLLQRGFGESNPLFGPLLRYGGPVFIGAKILFLVGPILLLEFVRTRNPRSAEQGTWIAFLAYAALYIAHLARLA